MIVPFQWWCSSTKILYLAFWHTVSVQKSDVWNPDLYQIRMLYGTFVDSKIFFLCSIFGATIVNLKWTIKSYLNLFHLILNSFNLIRCALNSKINVAIWILTKKKLSDITLAYIIFLSFDFLAAVKMLTWLSFYLAKFTENQIQWIFETSVTLVVNYLQEIFSILPTANSSLVASKVV